MIFSENKHFPEKQKYVLAKACSYKDLNYFTVKSSLW